MFKGADEIDQPLAWPPPTSQADKSPRRQLGITDSLVTELSTSGPIQRVHNAHEAVVAKEGVERPIYGFLWSTLFFDLKGLNTKEMTLNNKLASTFIENEIQKRKLDPNKTVR